MFGVGCKMNHQGMKPAGIYMTRKVKRKERKFYTPHELTWACPHCHLVFLKSEKEIKKWLAQKHKSLVFT